jgi:hypothetical protein
VLEILITDNGSPDCRDNAGDAKDECDERDFVARRKSYCDSVSRASHFRRKQLTHDDNSPRENASLSLEQRYLKGGLYDSAATKYFHFLGRLNVDLHTTATLPEPKSTLRWYMLSTNRKLPWQDKKYYTCWLPTVSYQVRVRRTPKSTVLSCNCSFALNLPVMFPWGVFGHHDSP